jgi:hypothetical protein
MEVALIFHVGPAEFTKIVAECDHLSDEEEAVTWAYEKFGEGRECVGYEYGTAEFVAERLATVWKNHLE